MLLALFFVMISALGVDGQAKRFDNVVSVVGDVSNVDCRIIDGSREMLVDIRWDHKSTLTGVDTTLFNGGVVTNNRSGRLTVEHLFNESISRLAIEDVQPQDAGIYMCFNSHAGEAELQSELTVLGGIPDCQINITGEVEESDHVLVTCNMSVYGTLRPTIRCYNNPLTELHYNITLSKDDNSTEVFTWNLPVTHRMHLSQFACTVSFKSNVDKRLVYNYTWTSPHLDVAYGPYSVTIDKGNRTEFKDGDQILCTADGNPRPNYHWIFSGPAGQQTIQKGSHFTINICEIVPSVNDNKTRTRDYSLICFANRGMRMEQATANIVVISSIEDRRRCRPETTTHVVPGVPSSTELATNGSTTTEALFPVLYLVVGGSGAAGLVIVIVTTVCCVKCSRYRRSQRAAVAKRAGLYTPNNPFYDDAQAADPDHYAELPTGYSGLHGNDEQYEEINDDDVMKAALNATGENHLLNPLSYQRLASEQRELPRPPGVYRQLGDTTDTTDISSGYIDVTDPTEPHTKPTPYQKLESESRDQPVPPGEYRHLSDTTVDSAIPTGNTPGYIDIIDDVQRKSAAPSSYQKLKSDDLPQQPAPPSEYHKLTDNVVVTENSAVYSCVHKNRLNV